MVTISTNTMGPPLPRRCSPRYTYAPAFAAAKPKEDQIYCIGKPEIEGKSFCAAWQNKTCTDAGYRTPYNSIVTDVSVCLLQPDFEKI